MRSTSRTGRRRLPAGERRAEILRAASVIAVSEGLDKLTAKRVAQAVGVVPGLVDYHFKSADELIAAAFSHAATADNDAVFEHAARTDHPVDQVRQLMQAWLHQDRDPVSLLWLDAWQASRRRPALLTAVTRQMNAAQDRLQAHIEAGVSQGCFRLDNSGYAAMHILVLIDGLSPQAAMRTKIDYAEVRELITATAERILGLDEGALAATQDHDRTDT
ncbi:TetR/AcrR family transcriptional regulator [Streptomyces sp. NPDC056938]|uniref:TetR/AcrR family transcriptional regulator n=1 Tax=unclassified Streptomyces TaxID=2593676 RepID=UPI0036420912